MLKKVLEIITEEYDSFDGLAETDKKLVLAAREAATKAYAPYSGFNVGAAVFLGMGEFIKATNQEIPDFREGLFAGG